MPFSAANTGRKIMSYYLAPSLAKLRDEVNASWPGRSKASDGWIGDRAHRNRKSDHNPNSRGSVNALDVTVKGIDKSALIAAAKRHPSVQYIISDRKIMNRDIGNFRARNYSGSNPHTAHVHISIKQNRAAEQDTRSWGIASASSGSKGASSSYTTVTYGQLLKAGVKGSPVRDVQRVLRLKTDGYFGADTKKAVIEFQKQHGLTPDGIVGPRTWSTIKANPRFAQKKTTPAKKNKAAPAPGPKTPFPLPKGYYFGPKSGGNRSVSGFYGRRFKGKKDSTWLKEWANQLTRRGWSIGKGKTYLRRAGNDGKYGPEYQTLIRAFQRDQKLRVDGLLGEKTWNAAFHNPIT